MKKIIVLFLCAAMLWPSPISFAGPKGGKVVGGNAQISQKGPSTTINQTTDRAIINWNSFDINKNESVRHNMPSSNSAGLHRVVGGGGASQIAGSLQSNGNIYLVNPAGVVIHNGAKIDVHGFVATSRDISDQNFMKGNMVFDKPGHPDAKIINKGNITLKDNGLAVLVAPTVRNDGVIAGKLGKVALGASDAVWKLDMTGDDLIAFTLDEKAVNTLHSADGAPLASVENNGKIKAEGGVVVMSAAQLDGFVGSVVNNGEISAASVESKGGKIIFRGQGDRVDLVNNGKLNVSSQSGDGGMVRMSGQAAIVNAGKIDATGAKGGKVVLTGKDITLKSGSTIDASGINGGGTVLVGGNAKGKGPEPNAKTVTVQSDAEILASAKLKGDGGQVVVWADEKTQFDGRIEAKGGDEGGDGGFVETSAKLLIIGDPAIVNTSANRGKAGDWLLDPEDFIIASNEGTITPETIVKNLETGNISIVANSFGLGDIYVNDPILWSSDYALHLVAYNNINVNADITATGDNAGLYLDPENGKLNLRAPITLSGKNPSLTISGKKYKVINSVEELQKMNDDPGGNFALGTNIDATVTKSWNNGDGFKPIGKSGDPEIKEFTGNFNGLGHIIEGLTINRPNETHVGLFGFTRLSIIENVGLENVNIIGKNQVGSMMGCSYTSGIYNSYSTGQVTADLIGGGFIGRLYGGKTNDPIGYPEIINCFTTCDVKALNPDSERFGGFIAINDGWTPKVENSYSTGKVPNAPNSGGFCGANGMIAYIDRCFWDKDTSGMASSKGYQCYSASTAAMKKKGTFTSRNWDFDKTWSIKENEGYPTLQLFASRGVGQQPPKPDPGTNPGDNPGSNTGENSGTNPGTNPGDNPGSNTGDNSGNTSDVNTGDILGSNAGENSGTNPGTNTGDKPGSIAGDASGTTPGANTGDNPGSNAGENSGTTPNVGTETDTGNVSDQKPITSTNNPSIPPLGIVTRPESTPISDQVDSKPADVQTPSSAGTSSTPKEDERSDQIVPIVVPTQRPDKIEEPEETNTIFYYTGFGKIVTLTDTHESDTYRKRIEDNEFNEILKPFYDIIQNAEIEYFNSDEFHALPVDEQLYQHAVRMYKSRTFIMYDAIESIKATNNLMLLKTAAINGIEGGMGAILDVLTSGDKTKFTKDLLNVVVDKNVWDMFLKNIMTNQLFDCAEKSMSKIQSVIDNKWLSKTQKAERIANYLKSSAQFYAAAYKLLDSKRTEMYKTAEKSFLERFFDAEKKILKDRVKSYFSPLKEIIGEEIDEAIFTNMPDVYRVIQIVKQIKYDIDDFKDSVDQMFEPVKNIMEPVNKVEDAIDKVEGKVNQVKTFIDEVNADLTVSTLSEFIELIEKSRQLQ